MKKALLILSLIMSLSVSSTFANEYNLGQMNYNAMNKIITDIVTGVNEGSVEKVEHYAMYMTSDVYEGLTRDINDKFLSGSIGTIAIDTITVDNSSDYDDVIMVNIKVWSEGQTYNKLYLYEFHVNKDGKIYGYNAWLY